MKILSSPLVKGGVIVALAFASVKAAYWWSNVPPKPPSRVSRNAVFLWAGHLGLPAPKHGTWLECWTDTSDVNKCRLTNMDGTVAYEGVYLPDKGITPVSQSDLRILSEETSSHKDLGVHVASGEPANIPAKWHRTHPKGSIRRRLGKPGAFPRGASQVIPLDSVKMSADLAVLTRC